MVLIDNRQDKIQVHDKFIMEIEALIDYALKEEKVTLDYEVSLIFVDNEEIKRLNSEFRNIDIITDVLSFPMLNYPEGRLYKEIYQCFNFDVSYFDEDRLVLGDIALSLEKTQEQSIEYGHSFNREACYLLIHSILHLLGYDHMEENQKKVMRKREEEILNKFDLCRDNN